MAVADFEHKGIAIQLWGDGRFHATLGAEHTEKPSLDAMKKAIDAYMKEAEKFEPFAAIAVDPYAKKLQLVNVTGVKKPRGGGWSMRNRPQWITEPGTRVLERIIRDTPENRAAVEPFLAARRELEETQKRLEKIADDAFHALAPLFATPEATP